MSPAQSLQLEAWSTYVFVAVERGLPAAGGILREELDRIDRAASRFRADSDLSRVNREPGRWVEVSDTLLEALEVALAAAAVTDGLVDPCLGRQITELGYDRDLRSLRPRRAPAIGTAPRPGAWRGVEIDGHRVRIPADVALDLGATAKAWAADVIAERVRRELGTSVVLSIGGDVRVANASDARTAWPIRITETPGGREERAPAAVVHLDGGGLATSSTRVRRWRAGGTEVHHLLDPRTGAPARGPWSTATATGPTCVAANVASTAAMVLGGKAIGWLEERAVDARLVSRGATITTTGRWPREAGVA